MKLHDIYVIAADDKATLSHDCYGLKVWCTTEDKEGALYVAHQTRNQCSEV